MPPQRSSRKLTPQAQHALIRKYNISIEGPVRRRDWPPRYAPIFGLVRDMEKVQYEEYSTRDYGSDDVRRILVSKMCNRVEKLVTQAHALRESLDNEETWRLKTENLIIERFEEDVDCHICADRRWISDFQAIPSCPDTAARLTGIRGDRKLCQCSEATRAKLLAEASSQNTFITKGSCTVVDRSMAEIQKKMLAHHRPDRVLGLGRTPELEHLLAASPSIPRTVIGEDMDMYFPFLVLEAKSEKNSVGFESIERQTVFPIRAMLDLQRNLEAASNVPFDPLVWFLANRGDEWRVYACVPHRAHTNIIDLWHGSILRHDSALQLLLVIDLLCDWARDIFMERIIKILQEQAGPDFPGLLSHNSVESLAPIQEPLPDSTLTPPRVAAEITSSPQPEQSISTGPEIAVKSEIEEDVGIGPVPYISSEKTPAIEDSTTVPPARSPSKQPTIVPHEEREEWNITPDDWPEHMAIRSTSDVQLRFRSLSLPESAHDISTILEAMDGKANKVQTARKLLRLFSLHDPFMTTGYFIDRIRRAWRAPESRLRGNKATLVCACLHWRASIDYFDWVLTKEIACITASPVAIRMLSYICNLQRVMILPDKPTEYADRLIHPLRYLPLPELVQAASKNQFLQLEVLHEYAAPGGWVENPEKAALAERLWECRDSQPKAFTRCLDNTYSVTRGTDHFHHPEDGVLIPPALQVPDIAKERRFALLRRPPDVEDTRTPVYCVYAFDSNDPPVIGSAVISFLREGFGCFYGTGLPLTARDREYLTRVSKVLVNLV